MPTTQRTLIPEVLSISDLNSRAKQLLESRFSVVTVEGELSSFSQPVSGHWYLTLKDERAQLSCVMFSGQNSRLKFVPEVGDKLQVQGSISLFEPRGSFQMIATKMKLAGEGELQQIYERLKKKLETEGLFDEARKQPIPEDPQVIAVITSPQAAALQDVLNVLKRRAPHINVYLLPSTVQGENGAPEIIDALQMAERLSGRYKPDLILLTRGGGSPEDLWNFNEESVVRAMHACPIPIVNAVGHQIDFSLADFVADMRAPTPSAAAELISPDNEERIRELDGWQEDLLQSIQLYLKHAGLAVRHIQARLRQPHEHIAQQAQHTDILYERLVRSMTSKIERFQDVPQQYQQRMQISWQNIVRHCHAQLEQAIQQLDLVNPVNVLKRGYSIIRNAKQELVSDAARVSVGDTVEAQLARGKLQCEVRGVSVEKQTRKTAKANKPSNR